MNRFLSIQERKCTYLFAQILCFVYCSKWFNTWKWFMRSIFVESTFFSRSLFHLLASATNRILYQRWKCFLVETDWTTDRDAVTLVCWKRSIEMSVVMMIVAGCMLPCRRCKNHANVCSVRSKWNFSVNGGSSVNVTMGNHANVWNSHANGRIELEWRLKIRQICILHLWWNGFQSLKKEPFNN